MDVFAGIPVGSYAAAAVWYERLLGSAPAFFPHDTEAVWELAEHRYLYVVEEPEHAGHARITVLIGDLDAFVARAEAVGSSPHDGKPLRTVCARSPIATPTETNSPSATRASLRSLPHRGERRALCRS